MPSSPNAQDAPGETTAPYGGGTAPAAAGAAGKRRVRIPHLQAMTDRGDRWSMLTAYDMYTAEIFDEAGIEVLLVGDSAGNNVYGYDTTLPVSVEEMLFLTRAVSRAATRALVLADLPFGSYQASPEQGYLTAARFMKEGGAHAVKLEGGVEMAPTIERLVRGGIPVCAHIGFTPQSEHTLGGYRVQGRGEEQAERTLADARAVEAAGAFAVVLEMVPAPVAARVSEELRIPTVGIGAGPSCDAQVLVWQDMAGLRGGKAPRFVKKYADLRGELSRAAGEFAREVQAGTFPAAEHSFDA
ncbi:3-methyl-2-oxobutanoate hydroxymethyltransferase [Janibacter melonis]|uniref:3-methyl-2-oxobutanoate hydroxymethyltransferase n=1 Tax=Janibacter melonis TaxID=262209 RepID=UPI0020965FFF|nr:3-methyl-2-oxobutanoate hydroxymethyltransferase [Janibacter melonis]